MGLLPKMASEPPTSTDKPREQKEENGQSFGLGLISELSFLAAAPATFWVHIVIIMEAAEK